MSTVLVSGAIEIASRVASGGLAASNKASSLIDVASVARVEPIVMLDADCVNLPEIGDIMQSLQSIFAGYYLQAVNIMSTIGNVSVASKLGPLNPGRHLGFEGMYQEIKKVASMEDFKFKLPTRKNQVSMEAQGQSNSPATSEKTLDKVSEVTNLSVGKIYNVQIRHNEQTATIPVSIRLMVNMIPSRMMLDLFTYRDNFDMDMKERIHDFRSGRLEGFKDLLLCRDLIDKRRRAGIRDRTGIMGQINNRESKNFLAGFLNGKSSVATASNIAVLSTDTLETIETELNGRISNAKVRNTIFENTNLMILAVVDKGYERVIFYHRGLDSNTNVSFRELKSSTKGNGSDVTDILKAYISGASPTL